MDEKYEVSELARVVPVERVTVVSTRGFDGVVAAIYSGLGRPDNFATLLQRLALQQLHGNERVAVGFVNVIDCADVRMIQRRGGASFAFETLQSSGSLDSSLGRNFSATKRPSFVSSALYTTPIPPPPSSSRMR